jgi:hypothetical protein
MTVRGECERVRKKMRMKESEQRLSYGGAAGPRGRISADKLLSTSYRDQLHSLGLTKSTTGCNPTVNKPRKSVSMLSATEPVQDRGPRGEDKFMKFLFSYPPHLALCLEFPNVAAAKVVMNRKTVA